MRFVRRLKQTVASLTTSVVGGAIVFSLLLVDAELISAQSNNVARGNGISIEANPFRGTVTYSRFASRNWELGGALGFGFPQLDQTLFRGKTDDFRDYVNLSAIARRHYGKRALLELGARVGVADYQRCDASDCWPRLYFGPSVMFAVGGEHVKVGPRLTFGEINSASGDLDVFASVSPVNVMLSWRW